MKNLWKRKIIHVDMDAFFASIEQRDHPEFRNKPVVVGGDPFGRGVVSTASYEARKFGIHSAMPAIQAKKLCPQAVFARPRFSVYQKDSEIIMSILKKYTERVEAVSLDEAYLDATENRLNIEDPVMLAKLIKQNIFAATKLTASAGVAPNMFLAKVASDFQKPDGLTVVRPGQEELFLRPMPVRKIPGVGPVTEKELLRWGIRTCGQLAEKNESYLYAKFGKMGMFLHRRALGLDDREVEPESEPKQYSVEETFPKDTRDTEFLKENLRDFSREVFLGLRESGRMGRTIVLKIKYFDFEQITRSHTLDHEPKSWDEIYRQACHLLEAKTLAGKKAVRLIGLGISGLRVPETDFQIRQLDLFEKPS